MKLYIAVPLTAEAEELIKKAAKEGKGVALPESEVVYIETNWTSPNPGEDRCVRLPEKGA